MKQLFTAILVILSASASFGFSDIDCYNDQGQKLSYRHLLTRAGSEIVYVTFQEGSYAAKFRGITVDQGYSMSKTELGEPVQFEVSKISNPTRNCPRCDHDPEIQDVFAKLTVAGKAYNFVCPL